MLCILHFLLLGYLVFLYIMFSTGQKWVIALFSASIIVALTIVIYLLPDKIKSFDWGRKLAFFIAFGVTILANQLAYKYIDSDKRKEMNINN